jgi:hypothetical protein
VLDVPVHDVTYRSWLSASDALLSKAGSRVVSIGVCTVVSEFVVVTSMGRFCVQAPTT